VWSRQSRHTSTSLSSLVVITMSGICEENIKLCNSVSNVTAIVFALLVSWCEGRQFWLRGKRHGKKLSKIQNITETISLLNRNKLLSLHVI